MKPGNWNSFSAELCCELHKPGLQKRGLSREGHKFSLSLSWRSCRFCANSGKILRTVPKLELPCRLLLLRVQQFPCSARSEMIRQVLRRADNVSSASSGPRGSLRCRELAILLLMTGPVSSKYLMMGDIWRGAAILMVIRSSIRIRPGPVSNPVCHCHTAAVRPSDHSGNCC